MSLFLRLTDRNLGAIESRGGQTFVEFAREKGNLFNKWSAANGFKNDFNLLRQLVLFENFKDTLPEKVVMFLNEQKLSTLSGAAVLADEFVLTHKNVFSSPLSSDRSSTSRPTRAEPSLLPSDKARGPPFSQPGSHECIYCHKKCHVIAECLSLKQEQQAPATAQQKNVCLVKTIRKCVTE